MRCPEDGTKITTKHYDPEYEFFECPKCEGCFTADELEEAENGTSVAKRKNSSRAGADSVLQDAVKRSSKRVAAVAKGKKRLTEIQEDDEALAEFEKKAYAVKKSTAKDVKHRDESHTAAIVTTWAAELQEVYNEFGAQLDDDNAKDKALTIWREIHFKDGVSAREKPVPHVLCAEHS